MYFFYSLLLGLGFLILLPRFVFDGFKKGKYAAGFRERLGLLSPIPDQAGPVIWVHCVSVGETQAARPLVQGLRNRYPNHSIAVSTITVTGQKLAREIFTQEVEKVFYFPFDWRWIVRRTIKAIKPAAVVIMETELWPGFLRECEVQQIPVAIVNGRISERSFRRYRLIRGFMKRVLNSVSLALMQTEKDAARLGALGMSDDKIFVAGNIKFDAGNTSAGGQLAASLKERFQLSSDRPLVLAASTHAPEERMVLQAFSQLTEVTNRPRLMVAPRHPERFNEVAAMIKASGFKWTRRSETAKSDDEHADVILLDSIGELQSIYSLASIVFVGGSIAKTGGHNIVEPAGVGACVITGAYTYNFQAIVETFVNAGAVIQLPRLLDHQAAAELARVISELLANPAQQEKYGRFAAALVEQNRGTTERTLELLKTILPSHARTITPISVSLQSAPTS